MKNILLVEDNETYAEAAKLYLASVGGLEVTRARDYTEAMTRLDSSIDGVITDLFFPETMGSGKVDLGKRLVERITEDYRNPALEERITAHKERVANELRVLSQEIDLKNPELQKYMGYKLMARAEEVDPAAMQRSLDFTIMLCKDGKQDYALALMKLDFPEEGTTPRCGYLDLMAGIEESEANQPLGVLVAEKAHELGKPNVIATSTYHHGTLTSPIHRAISDGKIRCGDYHMVLIDLAPGKEHIKTEPRFWEHVFSTLMNCKKHYGSQ